jgi:ABC-type multidrug transport system ATPase subunit
VLGLNGAGKSTLLRIMAGIDTDYRGEAQLAPGATVGLLEQEPHLDESKDVRGNVEDGVAELRALLDRFNELAANYSDETADEFARLQDRIDAADAWNLDSHLDQAMDALRLPPGDADVTKLSGGERRRVISTPSRSRGWRSTSRTTRAPSSPSPTIATSSTTSPAGSSSSIAATASRSRATTRAGSSRRKSG